MQLSANENFPGKAVDALRGVGHDVFWVRTQMGGATDQQVLAHAVAESRVLVTFDKDFGDLAFHANLPASCGIILFRISTRDPDMVAARVVSVIDSRPDWAGVFAFSPLRQPPDALSKAS
jgi:predicted nuclease of predicted toxin-antitoxin system